IVPNTPPTLAPIPSPAGIPQSAGSQTIALSGLSDGGDGSQTLTVTATSSNPTVIPNPTVNYTSPNPTGTLTFTPVPGISGPAMITVTVEDGGAVNAAFTRCFVVTVLPA